MLEALPWFAGIVVADDLLVRASAALAETPHPPPPPPPAHPLLSPSPLLLSSPPYVCLRARAHVMQSPTESFSPEVRYLPLGAPHAWQWNTAGEELLDKRCVRVHCSLLRPGMQCTSVTAVSGHQCLATPCGLPSIAPPPPLTRTHVHALPQLHPVGSTFPSCPSPPPRACACVGSLPRTPLRATTRSRSTPCTVPTTWVPARSPATTASTRRCAPVRVRVVATQLRAHVELGSCAAAAAG